MQIIILPLCVEQDYGKLSGKSMDELRKSPAYRKYFHISESEKAYALNPPGGESWEDLKKRAAKCLRWLDRHYAGKKVVVVSHSDFINCIYGVKNGLEDSKIWLRGDLQNCQIIRI
jgi:broad specificity phosphatase PhoE